MKIVRKEDLTISLNYALVEKPEAIASGRLMTVSALIAELIEKLVDDDCYEAAAASAISRMERGMHMGGGILAAREELYDW